MNHHLEKRRVLVRYRIWWASEPGGEEAHQMRRLANGPLYAANFSASSSFGLLLFKVRMGLLLLQIRCWASF